MKTILKFNSGYFFLAIVFFAIEVMIALFVHDTIIRPYIGDLLVVILIYCMVRSFLNTPVFPTAMAVLVFSFVVEASQYFHLISLLGLQQSGWARVILGSSFSWMDLVTYTAGIIIVLIAEKVFPGKLSAKQG